MNSSNEHTATKLSFFTLSDPNYIGMVPVLFEGVRKHYPDATLYLFMIGKGEERVLDGDINIIYVDELMNPRDLEQRLCFYLNVELATSFRPHCFQRLFDLGHESVVYLDPDLYIFRRMTEMDDLLAQGVNGIVTPHALKSITGSNAAIAGGDRIFLQVGIFNLGFLALNKSDETFRMLRWWRDKLKWQCTADTRNGLFVDQKWIELLPIYFENFHILRLPTYNLAPWNAEHYSVFTHKGQFYLDTTANHVAFIHFSGVKRSRAHFKDMADAYEFYIPKLNASEKRQYKFEKYSVAFSGRDLVWDKIITFLYREYVAWLDDRWTTPTDSEEFYDYAIGMDTEADTPRYLRKAFELYPSFASVILVENGKISFDRLIVELKNKGSPYAGVADPQTVARMKAIVEPIILRNVDEEVLAEAATTDEAFVVLNAKSVLTLRQILKKFGPARAAYSGLRKTRRVASVFNRLRTTELQLQSAEARLAESEERLAESRLRLHAAEESQRGCDLEKERLARLLKLVLRQTHNAEYVK